jgi:hypothetical protein
VPTRVPAASVVVLGERGAATQIVMAALCQLIVSSGASIVSPCFISSPHNQGFIDW